MVDDSDRFASGGPTPSSVTVMVRLSPSTLAVRVLDAVRAVGSAFGQVDVTYKTSTDGRDS